MRGKKVASAALESAGLETMVALVLFAEVVDAEAVPVVGGNKRLDLDVTLVIDVLLRRMVGPDGVTVAAIISDVAPSSVELRTGLLVDRSLELEVSTVEEGQSVSE